MLEIVTGVIVATVALALVLEPLLRPAGFSRLSGAVEPDFQDIEESDSPKVQALLALREIDFDRATGKLSDADYADLRKKYAAMVLEAVQGEEAAATAVDGDDAAEAAIERIKSIQLEHCPTCNLQLEPGSAFCSNCGRSLLIADAPQRCWTCGSDLQPESKFCGGCGSTVTQGVSTA